MNFIQTISHDQVIRFFRPVLFLLVTCFFSFNSFAGTMNKKNIPLAPKGQEILEEKLTSYPSFDLKKASKEAKEKYPMTKEGTKVTLSYRRNQVSGSFRGTTSKSVKIGTKKVPKMDLTQWQLAKFDKQTNTKIRQMHVDRLRSGYNAKKMLFEQELIAPLVKQYPPISPTTFVKVFRKIKPPEQAKKYNKEILKQYNDSLPKPEGMSKKQFLRKTLKDFLAKHSDLVLDGYYVISVAEKKKKEEVMRLAEEARLKKLAERITYPRAATPIFTPDGGDYKASNKVTITTPTEGAEIRYTLDNSTPTETSPLYKAPLSVKMSQKLKAVAFHPEFNDSDVGIIAPWAGNGLYASYFNSVLFKGTTKVKLDKEVFFDWGKDPLPSGVVDDGYSALWTGTLIAPDSGEYTFYLQGDDGVRMWLNGKVFIDGWKEQSRTEYKETANLVGGKKYDIKLALVELGGTSSIMLEWSTDKMARTRVSSNCLDPHGKETDKVRKWNKKSGGKYINRKKMTNPGSVNKKVLLRNYNNKLWKKKSIQQLRGGI